MSPVTTLGGDAAARTDHKRQTGFRAGSRCRHDLDESHVVRKDVARRRTRRVFRTDVWVAHPNRQTAIDGHVSERDLPQVTAYRLHVHAVEGAPAWMDVGSPDPVHTHLRRSWEIRIHACGGPIVEGNGCCCASRGRGCPTISTAHYPRDQESCPEPDGCARVRHRFHRGSRPSSWSRTPPKSQALRFRQLGGAARGLGIEWPHTYGSR